MAVNDNFDRLNAALAGRRGAAHRPAHYLYAPTRDLYLNSALLKRLASAADCAPFSPTSADGLEHLLKLWAQRHDEDASARKARRDGLQARHAELSAQADEQAALLEHAPPYVTIPVVIGARATLDALHFVIGRVELALDAMPADAEPPSLEALEAGGRRWHSLLRDELARIRREAVALPAGFILDADPDALRLLDDLEDIDSALSDVKACLEILERRVAPIFTSDISVPKKPDYTGSVKPSPFAAWRDSHR
jgi:hypothetical protein